MTRNIEWDDIDLVVFDMDGTLYDQRPLRMRMLGMLAKEIIRSRSLAVPRILAAFRRRREELGEARALDFAERQYDLPGHSPEVVCALVAEWMLQRPLPFLALYRTPGVERLFDALMARNAVALFSDYPVADKLASLGLSTAFSVTPEEVGRLKPDPAGLIRLIEEARTVPSRTLMIGDRADRDGEAARRAGVAALIRGRDFRDFNDPIFHDAA